MDSARTRTLLIAGGAVALLVGVWALSTRNSGPSSLTKTPTVPPSETAASSSSSSSSSAVLALSVDASSVQTTNARFSTKWGSRDDELGRSRPQEGNPEGPMSFAEGADGELLVLDQVNGKVTRFDKSGKAKNTFKTSLTTQDIAVAKDGTVVLLDRLVEKSIRLIDKNGRPIGTLSLPADRLPDPGLTTGVFVDGKDVYVEKEHGTLVRIGGLDGKATTEPAELTGRPSKDGSLLLMAAFVANEGKVNLNVFDRKLSTLRFARVLPFPRPARQVVLLDSDAKGTIYVGLTAGKPEMVHVACIDPGDGHILGRVSLPANHTEEESFRDFVVMADGTIVASVRSEDGVTYEQARCP